MEPVCSSATLCPSTEVLPLDCPLHSAAVKGTGLALGSPASTSCRGIGQIQSKATSDRCLLAHFGGHSMLG
jgi:hypothetical protein